MRLTISTSNCSFCCYTLIPDSVNGLKGDHYYEEEKTRPAEKITENILLC